MAAIEEQNYSLSERTQLLLKVLVENYISGGQPLGSRTLARKSELEISPATVRNVMADLEDFGFVESPHTSAGRIPTTKGYRLFVDTMLKVQPITTDMVSQMKENLDPSQNVNSLVESASTLLSGLTGMAGLVTLPKIERAEFRHIEFLPLSEHRVLAILVMNQREVQNRILQADRDYTEA